jgi:ABC-2 type transport system ATP-binding protein
MMDELASAPLSEGRPGASAARLPAGTSASLLSVRGLTKRYGEQIALDDVSFDIRAGEVLGLIGPNGAGKTTLFETLAGVVPVDSADVRWQGRPLPRNQRAEVLFYLPDGVRPYPEQPVLRVLTFIADVYTRPPDDIADAVAAVGLGPVLAKRVSALSKGYSRRLMLALGLLTPHPLLLMDEPFDGLDLRQTADMTRLLRRVAGEGRTLMLAIHQLADAARVCDRFVLLAAGRGLAAGTLDELRIQSGRPGGSLEEIFLALT